MTMKLFDVKTRDMTAGMYAGHEPHNEIMHTADDCPIIAENEAEALEIAKDYHTDHMNDCCEPGHVWERDDTGASPVFVYYDDNRNVVRAYELYVEETPADITERDIIELWEGADASMSNCADPWAAEDVKEQIKNWCIECASETTPGYTEDMNAGKVRAACWTDDQIDCITDEVVEMLREDWPTV